MKIFLAGGTGAMGKSLIPQLVSASHHVVATTRTADKNETLRALGAEPVIMDALEMKAVIAAKPDAIVHQATSLGNVRNYRNFDKEFTLSNGLRTEGTKNLLEAARATGTRKFVAQSYSGWPNARTGGRIKMEEDALDSNPPKSMAQTLAAIRQLESMVLTAPDLEGTVLRYGGFYGPGTSIDTHGDVVELVRHHKFPIISDGAGVWSFIHIEDAAAATKIAIEGAPAGLYNIVDDEPAEVSVWLPELARIIGARAPAHVPAWLGRLAAGESGIVMMTQSRGSSNAKAKRALNWQLKYPSWRDGFRNGFSAEDVKSTAA